MHLQKIVFFDTAVKGAFLASGISFLERRKGEKSHSPKKNFDSYIERNFIVQRELMAILENAV